MADTNSVQKPYWAAVPSDEIAWNIREQVDKFYENIMLNGRLDLYRRSWAYYNRPRITGSRINPTGEQGELSAISVNHYRNLLLHLETMTTQQRAVFEPKATNSDVKSQSQVILATGLLDYYMREKRMERYLKQATKQALIFGEAFVRCEWDVSGGNVYGKTSTGALQYEGDIRYTNYMPIDVVRDFTLMSHEDETWYILRDFKNKYDLAARFPTLAEDILSDSVDMIELARTTTLNAIGLQESDNIMTYTLLHEPTKAMPQGRYTLCLDNGTVLLDGALPYKKAHVYRIAPDEESGTIFGFTVGYDLMPIQEALDILYSTAVTNQATFGVQNILVPKGHDLSTSQIAGGLNILEYDTKLGKPESLQLTQTPAEVFNFMGMLEKLAETISGVNSVARGNPEASLKSGAALALVQSMAIQFSMNLQQSYAALIEDLGTGTINILKDFASTPRVAMITGKSNRPLLREFKGEDLDSINRVMVDMGNPLSRTTAGKVNLADALMERNLVENADQYIQVVTTGRLEPVIEGKQAELLLIKAENEKLADGIRQRAIITDQHSKHILEHKTVLASPEARADPNSPVVIATLQHIQEHLDMLQTGNPVLLALIGQQSTAPQGQPPPPNADGMSGTAQMLDATNPVTQQAGQVSQPNMPSPPAGTDDTSAGIIQAAQQV